MSSAAPRAAAAPSTSTQQCPGGTGEVTCRTSDGLEPDESVRILFRLVADDTARPGQITGTVSTGTAATLKIKVPVRVELHDGVDLRVHAHAWRMTVGVKNTGETTKPATVTFDRPVFVPYGQSHGFTCTGSGPGPGPSPQTKSCTSDEALKPGEDIHLHAYNRPWWGDTEDVTVTASIGQATESETVEGWCFVVCDPPFVPDDPSESTEPSEPEPSEPPDDPPSVTEPPPSEPEESDDLELPGIPLGTSGSTESSPTTTTSSSPNLHRPAERRSGGLQDLLSTLLGG